MFPNFVSDLDITYWNDRLPKQLWIFCSVVGIGKSFSYSYASKLIDKYDCPSALPSDTTFCLKLEAINATNYK